MHTLSRLLVVAVGTLLVLAAPAGAALFTPPLISPAGGSGIGPDHNIDNLSLSLALTVDESVSGQTTRTYDLTLNADASAEWTVVDFAIIRDWSEGTVSGLTMPDDWSGSDDDHFIDWTGSAASALHEGDSATFGYTITGGQPSSQLFVYYVTKNDAEDVFPVISSDAFSSFEMVTPASEVVVPEPTAFALVGVAILGLWRRRRTV